MRNIAIVILFLFSVAQGAEYKLTVGSILMIDKISEPSVFKCEKGQHDSQKCVAGNNPYCKGVDVGIACQNSEGMMGVCISAGLLSEGLACFCRANPK